MTTYNVNLVVKRADHANEWLAFSSEFDGLKSSRKDKRVIGRGDTEVDAINNFLEKAGDNVNVVDIEDRE